MLKRIAKQWAPGIRLVWAVVHTIYLLVAGFIWDYEMWSEIDWQYTAHYVRYGDEHAGLI